MHLRYLSITLVILILKINSAYSLTQDVSLTILVQSPLKMEYVLAKSICKLLDRDLSSTKSQLNKYSCKKKHSKDFSFQCSKNAPNGWAKFYSVKFRNIEKKVKNCLG